MASNQTCPIFFDRLEVSNFLGNVEISGPILSGSCLGRQSSLRFDKIDASLSLPTLSPPGIKIHVKLTDGKSLINLYPVISYPKASFEINQTYIDGVFLEKLLGGAFKVFGKIKLESQMDIENGDLLEGNFSLVSTDFTVPQQNISGFNIPALLLRNLGIKGTVSEKNIINFSNIILGDNSSVIFAQLSGKLKLNKGYFQESIMELTGKLKLTKSFLTSFPILNLLLSGKTPGPDGMYNLKLQGPISSLKPTIF